jgi:5'-3' exonuclease
MKILDATNLIYVASHVNRESYDLRDYTNSIDRYVGSIVQDDSFVGFLDKSSFRSSFYPAYKANRKHPYIRFKYDIQQYMIDKYGFLIIDGLESDDLVSISKEIWPDAEIYGVDKDLKQIEGIYFKWNGSGYEKLVISKEESQFNLCMQLLVGDGVDNVRGLGGAGAAQGRHAAADRAPL